jgi:hypothetical protein
VIANTHSRPSRRRASSHSRFRPDEWSGRASPEGSSSWLSVLHREDRPPSLRFLTQILEGFLLEILGMAADSLEWALQKTLRNSTRDLTFGFQSKRRTIPMAKQHRTAPSEKLCKKSAKALKRAIDQTNPVKQPPTVGKPVIIDPAEDPPGLVMPGPDKLRASRPSRHSTKED